MLFLAARGFHYFSVRLLIGQFEARAFVGINAIKYDF